MKLTIERRRSIVIIGFLLVLFMLLGLAAPKHAEATTSSERYMASLINKARDRYDRSALRLNESLSTYARRHSAAMASTNRLYHNPYLRIWLRNWSWRILGENVGYGSSVSVVYRAFMASRPHKANILERRYRNVGVGIVSSGGRLWVTVIFRG